MDNEQQLAKAIMAAIQKPEPPKQVATDEQMVEFWAKKINAGAYVSPAAIKPDMARLILKSGQVTEAQLRGLGITA
jgi:hypothetical protein